MARVAERYGVMAAIALLLIALCLQGVDGNKVAAMSIGSVIAPGVSLRQVVTRAAAFVAIKTPLLIMALGAVVTGIACQYPVSTYKVGIMVEGDTFGFMAGVAFAYRRVFKFGMRCLLFGIRLLLEADKSKAKNCNRKNYFLHACLLS
jgi:hypothetical protein